MNTNQLCTNCGCTNPQKTYDGYWCKICKNEMSYTKHTPEPWVTVHHANGQQSLIQSNAKHLAECWSLDKKIDSQANASRIVACVNACAGMDDPANEIATLRARIAELGLKRNR